MSSEQTFKDALAHSLRNVAAGLLDMSLRMERQRSAMHNNAEFQTLDITIAETTAMC